MSDNIVYSTDPDWKSAQAKPAEHKPKQAEPVRVSFRRAHKGSGMTLVERLQIHPAGKEELLRKFKKKLGVGGTVKFGVLEIQGDHRDMVGTELVALGYKVKRLG